MPNIESSGRPLAYKIQGAPSPSPEADDTGLMAFRVQVRALEGMQKEAVVSSNTGSAWRMVSDEGHYLNGTDLAPFPLAFFTAGLQFSFISELLRHAEVHDVGLKTVALRQDNYYTMEGSALRGTMLGDAKSAEIQVEIASDASEDIIGRLVRLAEASSPAQAVMRDVLKNTFSLRFNGRNLPVTEVNPSSKKAGSDPPESFEILQPADDTEYLPDIISKVSETEKVFGVEGGAGSSLHADQKRTLHIHGEARVLDGMLMESFIQPFKPIGSTFHFLCDETAESGGKETAPPPLAYLSAGVGFCYMTQIGRYAHITKQNLQNYEIIQDNAFTVRGSAEDPSRSAEAHPVDTRVFLEADESDEIAQKTVSMGERTCFLHAAMRGSYPSIVSVKV